MCPLHWLVENDSQCDWYIQVKCSLEGIVHGPSSWGMTCAVHDVDVRAADGTQYERRSRGNKVYVTDTPSPV